MADLNTPQTWFVQLCFEDIYHTEILVMQGPLGEVVKKLNGYAGETGALCSVHSLGPAMVPHQSAVRFRLASELGMLLDEVAFIGRDFEYQRWRRSFTRVIESLPIEQRLVELENLQERLAKELQALQVVMQKASEGPHDNQAEPTPPTTSTSTPIEVNHN